MTIVTLLKKKQKQLKLTTYKLAKALGISFVTVQRVLDESSRPNGRTVPTYAKFLGISVENLEKILGPATPRGLATHGKRKTKKTIRGKRTAR